MSHHSSHGHNHGPSGGHGHKDTHGHGHDQGHTPAPSPAEGPGHAHTPKAGGTETQTYGFVKCKIAGKIRTQPNQLPNEVQYHVHADLDVAGADRPWDTAINVGTSQASDLLKYRLVPNFAHPITHQLKSLPGGFHGYTGKYHLPALDFLRSDILAGTGTWKLSDEMKGAPGEQPAAQLVELMERALKENADVYIFGRTYKNDRPDVQENRPGIHDVHMNQGSGPGHLHKSKDGNAVWQDGAVLFDFGDPEWTAYFTAFTHQTVPTNEVGDPVTGSHDIGDDDPGSQIGG